MQVHRPPRRTATDRLLSGLRTGRCRRTLRSGGRDRERRTKVGAQGTEHLDSIAFNSLAVRLECRHHDYRVGGERRTGHRLCPIVQVRLGLAQGRPGLDDIRGRGQRVDRSVGRDIWVVQHRLEIVLKSGGIGDRVE